MRVSLGDVFRTGLLLGLMIWPMSALADLAAAKLRCEYQENPAAIDHRAPRLSWIVQSDQRGQRQSAYRILVASSEAKLAADEGDLWDTGKVTSDRTLHIEYAGRPLIDQRRCYWKVRAWDKNGVPSPWSGPASWSMGLLSREKWGAEWIAADTGPGKPAVPARTPHNGYHSKLAKSADTAKWVGVDLGRGPKGRRRAASSGPTV